MTPLLQEMKKRAVEEPTDERKSWLVRFDYHVQMDADFYDCEIETEWEDAGTGYILSITMGDGRPIDPTMDLSESERAEIMTEAKETVEAYEIFKEDLFKGARLAVEYCEQYGYEAGTKEREIATSAFQTAYELAEKTDIEQRLIRVAELIGSIFYYGDFRAETHNERELEKELRNLETPHPMKAEIKPRVLRLTLKKKWFDMIASGEKKEEYRAPSKWIRSRIEGKDFDRIEFKNGYGKDVPTIEVEYLGWRFGTGNPSWGYDGKKCYVIQLGEILLKKNIPGE